MRIIADEAPLSIAIPLEPTLEDAYLYHTKDRKLPDTTVLKLQQPAGTEST